MTLAEQHTYDEPPWEPTDDPGTTPNPPPSRNHNDAPQDQVAEQLILGAAMIDPRHLTTAAAIVTGPDFYRPNHETIWRTLTHLHTNGHPTGAAAVFAHLQDTGELTRAGGAPYLHTLEHNAIAVADVTFYANRVDQLARRRHAIAHLTRGLQRLTTPGNADDVDHVLAEVTEELDQATLNLTGIPTPTTWTPVDLTQVLAGEHLDPPPTMLRRTDGIPLLYDGAVHTIAGESESGKTWLALLAAVQLLTHPDTTRARHVTFIDFEDRADRVIGRLLALGATPTQIRDQFSYVRPDRPLDDEGRTQLTPALTNTDLVILDGVTEAMTTHGFDLNSNADSATFQALLPRWIADHGPAVVLIDHVVKDKEKQDRFALGAQHKLAGIDGAAYLAKMIQPFGRGKRGLARIEVAKDRPGHVREHTYGRTIAEFTLDATASDVILTAHLTPPGADSGLPGQPFEPTHLMEKISRYVQANPGLSKKAIEDVINGKAATKRLALELLVTRGYIGAKTEARGRISHFHTKAYYPPTDPDDDTEQGDFDDPAGLGPDPDRETS